MAVGLISCLSFIYLFILFVLLLVWWVLSGVVIKFCKDANNCVWLTHRPSTSISEISPVSA